MIESAERALALDSMLADARLAVGLSLETRSRFTDAIAQYRRALELEPSNAFGHHVLGFALLTVGHTDAAVTALRRATQLDPLAKSAASALAAALGAARRFPEAAQVARGVLALDSAFPLGITVLGQAQAFGGQPDSALLTLERLSQLHPDAPSPHSPLLFAYAAAGRWEDAERLRHRLKSPGVDQSGGVDAAFADLVFGDPEPLLRLLSTPRGRRRWVDVNGPFGCNPMLDPLWSDARFRAEMRKLEVLECPHAQPWPLPPRPAAPS